MHLKYRLRNGGPFVQGILVNWFPASNDKMYKILYHMMTAWHGHSFRITRPLWGESISLPKGEVCWALMFPKRTCVAQMVLMHYSSKCVTSTGNFIAIQLPTQDRWSTPTEIYVAEWVDYMWTVSIVGPGTCSTARCIFLSRANIFRCWTW